MAREVMNSTVNGTQIVLIQGDIFDESAGAIGKFAKN